MTSPDSLSLCIPFPCVNPSPPFLADEGGARLYKLIHILVLIADLYLFRSPVGFIDLILIWRVGTTELILVHYFTLIHYLDSYHITV